MVGGPETRVRVAVIGCGAISDEHLPFIASAPYAELESVCDLSPALAELACERHGARRADTDVDRMLVQVRPDVVHVLSPPHTHPDLIRKALASGAHVICEKPLAATAAETKALLDSAQDAGRVLVETRNLLYNDVVIDLDRAIADGRIGRIREVDVELALDLGAADLASPVRMPAGIAHDYLPHLAYLLLHFAPELETPVDVVGTLANISRRDEIGIDHVDALVTSGQVRARLRISPDVLPHSLRVAVRGSEGSLEVDLYQPYLRREGSPWIGKRSPFGMIVEGARFAAFGGRNIRDRLLQHTTYHGMPRMLADVYEALLDGRPSPIGADEVLASAALIDCIVALPRRGA